jgi:hypothetical protein
MLNVVMLSMVSPTNVLHQCCINLHHVYAYMTINSSNFGLKSHRNSQSDTEKRPRKRSLSGSSLSESVDHGHDAGVGLLADAVDVLRRKNETVLPMML